MAKKANKTKKKSYIKKRHIFGLITTGVIITLLILVGLFYLIVYSTAFKMSFVIDETGDGLSGDLYLNGDYLGYVDKGELKLVWEDYYPGDLEFIVNHKDRKASFFFELNSEQINYGEAEFYLVQQDLDDLLLTVEDLYLGDVKQDLINSFNDHRLENDYPLLIVDDRLNKLSSKFSKEMIEDETLLDEFDEELILDSLFEQEVFLEVEYFFVYEFFPNSKTDLVGELYSEVISDSDLTLFFLEGYTSNLGVGITCEKEEEIRCVFMGITTRNDIWYMEDLRNDYLAYYDVYYDLTYEDMIDYPINVTYYFNSTKNAKLWLVDSYEDYDRIIERENVDEIFKKTGDNLEGNITLLPGQTFIVEASSGAIDYELRIIESRNRKTL